MIVTTLSRKGPSGLLVLPQSEGSVGGKKAFVSAGWGVKEASWHLQVPFLDSRFTMEELA